MQRVHTINLAGAWEPPAAPGAPWTRRFGRPAGLAGDVRVWLVIQPGADVGGLRLNDMPLDAPERVPGVRAPSFRHEITAVLAPRNVLTMVVPAAGTGDAAPAGAVPAAAHGRRPLPPACGRVWIEIEATDADVTSRAR